MPSEHKAVTKLAAAVADFADRHLGTPDLPRTSKVIHDALWGTQLLHRHEVAVVNTPLFQRLRRLHQTGFSFLTYPSTTHTRFEHSLGVLYQTDRLARSLSEKYSTADPDPMSGDKIKDLRIAALLHDCSHGPFSHTSEDVYSSFPEMAQLIAPRKPFEGSSASEVLAHYIFASDGFKSFSKKSRRLSL